MTEHELRQIALALARELHALEPDTALCGYPVSFDVYLDDREECCRLEAKPFPLTSLQKGVVQPAGDLVANCLEAIETAIKSKIDSLPSPAEAKLLGGRIKTMRE